MYKSQMAIGITASAIDFNASDSREKKMVKTLVSGMINSNPLKRPSIGDVLQELEFIRGE